MIFLAVGLLVNTVRSADEKAAFKDTKDKNSYAVGANLGNSLKRQEINVDLEQLIKGLREAFDGHSALSDEELKQCMIGLNQEIRAHQQEKRKELGEKNKIEGEKFLAENKTKPGVITLPDGLQYKILTEGKGESPKSNDMVTANYRGTFLDGTEFDSSYKHGKPYTTPANRVIKGWSEALQLMTPGAKWQLFIPSDLAYGERGYGQQIGPNATLVFEVELISFTQPAPPTTPPTAATAVPTQQVTSDIIKVPSKEELEKGAKIEVIKAADLEKLQKEQQQKQAEKK